MDGESDEPQPPEDVVADEERAARAAKPTAASRVVTAGGLAARAVASHGPILESARNFAGLKLAGSAGAATKLNFNLAAGQLASAYLTREMTQGRLDIAKATIGMAGVEKLNVGALAQVGLMQTKVNLGDLSAAASGGLTTNLIAQWRDTLAIGHKGAQVEVAGAISRLIADNNLNRLALAGMPPGLTGESLGQRIADITRSSFSGIGQELRNGILGSIRPAALAATQALMDRLKASSEQERRSEDALWEMGWWMPPSASMDFFWEVGGLAEEGRRHALRRAMTEAARSREFGRIVERWMDLPPFQSRRRSSRTACRITVEAGTA
jgi:hypothetical protein